METLTEQQQHEVFLDCFNKAKRFMLNGKVLSMQKWLFKEYLRKAIDKRDKARWIIDEDVLCENCKIAFVIEGIMLIDEMKFHVDCTVKAKKVTVIDCENNEYSLELITNNGDFNFNIQDACDEIAQEYSDIYTEQLKILETDR